MCSCLCSCLVNRNYSLLCNTNILFQILINGVMKLEWMIPTTYSEWSRVKDWKYLAGTQFISPLYHHHITAILPSYYYYITIVLLLYYHRITAILPSYYCYITIVLLLYYHHITAILPPYYCYNTIMLLLHYHCVIVFVLLYYCYITIIREKMWPQTYIKQGGYWSIKLTWQQRILYVGIVSLVFIGGLHLCNSCTYHIHLKQCYQ